jgi:hypothetical protein
MKLVIFYCSLIIQIYFIEESIFQNAENRLSPQVAIPEFKGR